MTLHYDLPAADYHATDALTSTLVAAFAESPQLYMDLRHGLIPRTETKAMRFGTNAHMAVLEPASYACLAIKPEGMSFASREGKKWREDNAAFEIIDHEDAQRIRHMLSRQPSEVARFLGPEGRSEVTLRVDMPGIGLAQCRFDRLDMENDRAVEFKTIRNINAIEREVYARKYHLRAAFYQRLYWMETGRKLSWRFVFAETAAPFRWRHAQMDVDLQLRAEDELENALADLAARLVSGDWSDPGELGLMLSPPSWLMDETDDDEGDDE